MLRTPTTNSQRPSPDADPAAPELAPLSVPEIQAQTDAGSFSRSRGYARGGRIFSPFRRGNTIHARCHGSTGGPYRVEATLAAADQDPADNPIAASCDCPRGGFCKHIVALLLRWLEAPDEFVVHPPVAELLAGKSREELVALIELMLDARPDLDLVLRLPVAVSGVLSDAPVDEAALRRQITTAIEETGYGYTYDRRSYDYDEYSEHGSGHGMASAALTRLTDLGKAYAEAGQWRNALGVYATLVEQLAPELGRDRDYQELEYEGEDEIGALLEACDRGLAGLLDAQATVSTAERLADGERDRLIESLYTIWRVDIEAGGLDLAEAGPEAIGRHATAMERRTIGNRLRQSIVPGEGEGGNWSRDMVNRAALWFLSRLGPDGGLSDEELLAEYRRAELWEEAADTLLRTHRVEEAIALAGRRLTAAHSLTRFADQLIASGDERRIGQAISLVDGCLWEREGRVVHDDQFLSLWLERQFAAHGRPQQALDLAKRRFQKSPSRESYEAVMAAALLPDQPGNPWPKLRPDLLATLKERHDWPSLIDIHLAAGEATQALSAYKQLPRPGAVTLRGSLTYIGTDYAERVAAAVATTLPDEAIHIYRRLADHMIEHRQRPYYQHAARHLAEVKRLLAASDRTTEWTALITQLRQQHKTLRALREELDALDLA